MQRARVVWLADVAKLGIAGEFGRFGCLGAGSGLKAPVASEGLGGAICRCGPQGARPTVNPWTPLSGSMIHGRACVLFPRPSEKELAVFTWLCAPVSVLTGPVEPSREPDTKVRRV